MPEQPEQTEQMDHPIELEYDYESDEDTIMNDSVSIASSISMEDDTMDGSMTDILYPHRLTT